MSTHNICFYGEIRKSLMTPLVLRQIKDPFLKKDLEDSDQCMDDQD